MRKLPIILIVFIAPAAIGQTYLYGGLGLTRLSTSAAEAFDQLNETDTPLVSGSFKKFDRSKAVKNIGLGYQINGQLAAEIGYANLGEYKQVFEGTYSNGGTDTATVNSNIRAIRINGVYQNEITTGLNLLWKFGVSKTSNKVDTYLNPPVGPSFKNSVTRPFFGIGLSKDLGKSFFTRFDWDRYYTRFNYGPDYTDSPTPTYYGRDVQTKVSPIDAFSISVGYRF
jgi:hypothetical protein